MGRPKGSRNKPKEKIQVQAPVVQVLDEYQIPGGIKMVKLENIDMENLHVSLLAEIPGKGDWDFLIEAPFFRPTKVLSYSTTWVPKPKSPVFETLKDGYVSLWPDGRPKTLVLFIEELAEYGSPRKSSVVYQFPEGYWGDQEYQEYDN
jgi:hypothetical protein